jgi:hypothetical protein
MPAGGALAARFPAGIAPGAFDRAATPLRPEARPTPMSSPRPAPRQVVIHGVTLDGRPFRPSDWAERLAGAMSSFRPGGPAAGIGAYIGYSPYCVPRVVEGTKCVVVSEALAAIEPMAWDFVMSFARDNGLRTSEVAADASGAARSA